MRFRHDARLREDHFLKGRQCWVVIPRDSWDCIASDMATSLVACAPLGTGTGKIMRSLDGVNWVAASSTGIVAGGLFGVCWLASAALYVAVGDGGNIVTSADGGDNWVLRAPAAADNFRACAASPALVVAVGDGGAVQTSPDGINWTSRVSPAALDWKGAAWNGALFAAVASSGAGKRAMTSPDGVTWTLEDTADETWQAVAPVNAHGWKFVAVGGSGVGDRAMTRH